MNLTKQQLLLDQYGPPYQSRSHAPQIIPRRFVEYFKTTGQYIYAMNQFEKYNDNNGLWEVISEDKLFLEISDFAVNFGHALGFKDVDIALTGSAEKNILRLLRASTSTNHPPKPEDFYIHLKDCMLVFNQTSKEFERKEFSPGYNSHNQINLRYNPDAKCPRFINELITPMLPIKDCLNILQLYFGQCLLKRNLSQTILIISGDAGCGKSILVSILEKILGPNNVAELHPDRLVNQFEIAGYYYKSLLSAKDVPEDALSGNRIEKLKSMTGGDLQSLEQKHKNDRLQIHGQFNIIVTGNGHITVDYGNNRDSFERRLLWVPIKKPTNFKRITQFDDILLNEEAEGILAWIIDGALKLLCAGGQIKKSEDQQTLVELLLDESTAVDTFVKECVRSTSDHSMSSENAVLAFFKFAKARKWKNYPRSYTKICRALKDAMGTQYPDSLYSTNIKVPGSSKLVRGYQHCTIVLPPPQKKC